VYRLFFWVHGVETLQECDDNIKIVNLVKKRNCNLTLDLLLAGICVL